jgi:hypothetical protein
MNKPFSISNLINTYSRIYAQFDKENVSVIEAEMRKIVPSDESEVSIMAGANFTDNQIAVNLFISKPRPTEQTQNLNFVEILQQCILKAEVSKLKTMYDCADFLENSCGNYYFIDAIAVRYNDELDKYSFDFFIFKEKRRTKV